MIDFDIIPLNQNLLYLFISFRSKKEKSMGNGFVV